MKKVAGTLKLDQAQFRELEAFAKFGSDLDAATELTIEKGRKNQEVLKQGQYSPVTVQDQVAIIFASTNGFLNKVPTNKVKEFEREYLDSLNLNHKDLMASLGNKGNKAKGDEWESTKKTLEETAKMIAKRYINK